MKTKMTKRYTWPLLVLVASVCLPAVPAIAVDYHLIAGTTNKTMPDGAVIPMWGFATDPAFGGDGVVTVPGPMLEVPSADTTLTVYVTNNLTVPVSIAIRGQQTAAQPVRVDMDGTGRLRARSLTHETAPAATGTYTWTGVRPGTYVYYSATHPAVQVQMGLYGGVKKDAAAGEAYPGITYDAEVVLFYSEIDPVVHQQVDDGSYGTTGMTSTIDYQPKYFLVNGEPYSAGTPTIVPDPSAQAGDRVLIRLLNSGLLTITPTLLGAHVSLVAEDGNVYPFAKEQYTVTLPAGQAKDAIFTPAADGTYPIFDRRLNLTNAGWDTPGGMLRFIQVGP